MASVDFMRASVESKYMEEMYNSNDYQKLEETIEIIC